MEKFCPQSRVYTELIILHLTQVWEIHRVRTLKYLNKKNVIVFHFALFTVLKNPNQQEKHKTSQRNTPIIEGKTGQGKTKGSNKVTEIKWPSSISHPPIT